MTWSESTLLGPDDRLEAAVIERECVGRARGLWQKVIQGRRANVAAMVVLGALAGVRPLPRVAERPSPRRAWLQRVVERLAEDRLDREPLADQAEAVAAEVAARLGLRPPRILSAHVGVLATRFRHVVFGDRRFGSTK
jgi:hypothetical protein